MRLFLRCVAESIAEVGFKGLAEMVPGGPYAYSVAEKFLEKWRKRKREQQEHDEIMALANAKLDEFKHEVQEVYEAVIIPYAEQVADPPKPDDLTNAKLFLEGIQGSVRQSLRRVEDPSGLSVPNNFALQSADDVVKVLPQRPPRFRPNDAVPGKSGWVLERLLGTGGFGEVWFAKHKSMSSLSGAIKFCFRGAGRDLIHEGNLIDRVRAAGRHPNIVEIQDAHLEGESPWLMYEYVGGGDLTNWILTVAGFPIEERLIQINDALRQLCDAVAFVHQLPEPIVHRDLKPSNILVDDKTKKLRITDFGIGSVTAKIKNYQDSRRQTSRGGMLQSYLRGSHTPTYSSPQQRRGDAPDTRDDVHAIGVIAYQMLTGKLDGAPGPRANKLLEKCGASAELVEMVLDCASDELEHRPENASLIRFGDIGFLTPRPNVQEVKESIHPQVKIATKIAEPLQTGWSFDIVGSLYSRPRNQLFVDWEEICKTPAQMSIDLNKVYKWKIDHLVIAVDDSYLGSLRNIEKLQNLICLDLSYCDEITDAGLVHIAMLQGLTELDVAGCDQVTDAGLVHIAKLQNLNILRFGDGAKITDAGLAHIAKLQKITELTMLGCHQITDDGLIHIAKLQNLTHLKISGGEQITDDGLIHIAKLQNLTSLEFGADEGQLTDSVFEHLIKLQNLSNLSLLRCSGLTKIGIAQMKAALPNCKIEPDEINFLQTEEVSITDGGIRKNKFIEDDPKYIQMLIDQLESNQKQQSSWNFAIEGVLSCKPTDQADDDWEEECSTPTVLNIKSDKLYQWTIKTEASDEHLQSLVNLSGCPNLIALNLNECEKITNIGLSYVAQLINLNQLDLSSCYRTTDLGLANVAKLLKLNQLDLSSCHRITDVGLAHIAKLQNLNSLDIGGCEEITDVGLAHIAKLQNLENLSVYYCNQITDTSLVRLAKLTNLNNLNLESCDQITDAGLAYLVKLTNLKYLNVIGCDQITKKGIARLRKALPNLKIER